MHAISQKASKGDEVSAVGWFDLDDLPRLPFNHDSNIIKDLNKKMARNNLFYYI